MFHIDLERNFRSSRAQQPSSRCNNRLDVSCSQMGFGKCSNACRLDWTMVRTKQSPFAHRAAGCLFAPSSTSSSASSTFCFAGGIGAIGTYARKCIRDSLLCSLVMLSKLALRSGRFKLRRSRAFGRTSPVEEVGADSPPALLANKWPQGGGRGGDRKLSTIAF